MLGIQEKRVQVFQVFGVEYFHGLHFPVPAPWSAYSPTVDCRRRGCVRFVVSNFEMDEPPFNMWKFKKKKRSSVWGLGSVVNTSMDYIF
jgi:hypothetical protein